MDPLADFSPPTTAWFASAFGAPTAVQAATWPHIRAEHSVLAIAPTGSGKTLAAFLWAIDRCQQPREQRGVRVLYISPLKALAVDVERNLRAPLTGIAALAERAGHPTRDVTVALRTGDTPARDRQAMQRRPPDILITTPESLFLVMTSQARSMLADVETVIVDEVHSIAGAKRGAHLAVSLARLDHLVGRPVPRIGLSATVTPAEEAARFLGGDRPVHIVQAPGTKEWDLQIQVPIEDLADLTTSVGPDASTSNSIWPHVESRIVDLIEQHRSTIVFANSRRLAERLTARLNEIHASRAELAPVAPNGTRSPAEVMAQAGASAGAEPVLARAHHGSVSKEQRGLIEDDLKSGRLRAVVATSSLELGIDMGAVDLVIQVEAPPSVSSGLQRVGRAGHQVGATSRGVVLPKFRGDLLASAVVVQRMRDGQLEELRIPSNPLDVAAQQIIACVAMAEWTAADLLALLRTTAPFRDLTPAVFESVVEMLAGRYPSDAFAELRPRLVWDRLTDVLHGRPGAQRLAVTSGGTIPDRGLFGVFLVGGGRVGELDEEMVYESRVGDVFALGASSWQISEITHDRVLVVPAPGSPGRLPFWHGDALGRPAALGKAIGAFAREVARLPADDAQRWLGELGLDPWAARNLVAYVSEQAESGSFVPTDRTLVVERTRDELGDWRITVLSPFGAQVHAPWALVARERLAERFGVDAAVLHGDDGIVARLPDLPGDDWLPAATACLFPDPDDVEAAVTRLIGSSALFAARFRECASRALLLPRQRPGRRAPLWQQRQRSAQLLEIAAGHPTFPIVLETVRECLQDVYDLPALVELMAAVQARQIRVVESSPHAASPFARSLLFGYVAEFLYEGDSPLAERRAAALTLDPALLGELLGQSDLRDLLDPEAIEHVVAQVQHRTPDRQARHAEDAADLLRVLGPLSDDEARLRGVADEWLVALRDQRRIFQTRLQGREVWAIVEDAARLRDGLGAPLPPGLPEAHLQPVADPAGDLVSRYARTHGPFTIADVVGHLGLPPAVVSHHLAAARSAGRLIEGRFRTGLSGTQFCHPDVLRLIKRRSVALLRHQIEPVDQRALAVFLPRWQHIGPHVPAGRLRGAEGLLEAVRCLAGVPLPVSALESSILPQRIDDYSPGLLDELTGSGEVVWTGSASLPGGDAWVVLAPGDVGFLMPRAVDLPEVPLAPEVHELLAQGGGWFLADICRRLGPAGADLSAVGEALRSLLWAGLVSNDTLEPVRLARDRARAARPRGGGRGSVPRGAARLGRRPHGRYSELWHGGRDTDGDPTERGWPRVGSSLAPPGAAAVGPRPATWQVDLPGRWFALADDPVAPAVRAVAAAEAHLDRLGLVTRGAVVASGEPGGFAAAYRTLSAMEERGRVHRVYAVEGLGASQFALPGVVDQLREIQREITDNAPQTLVLAATDPANAYGAALDWPATQSSGESGSSHRPARAAGAHVVLRGGLPVLYLERGGRTLLTFAAGEGTITRGSATSDRPTASAPMEGGDPEGAASELLDAAQALADAVRLGRVPELMVTRINGVSALDPDPRIAGVVSALAAAGFSLTPRGYRKRR